MTLVDEWIAQVVAEFRTLEHDCTNPRQQELGLARHVLRALTEGGCPATASILEDIDRTRASVTL